MASKIYPKVSRCLRAITRTLNIDFDVSKFTGSFCDAVATNGVAAVNGVFPSAIVMNDAIFTKEAKRFAAFICKLLRDFACEASSVIGGTSYLGPLRNPHTDRCRVVPGEPAPISVGHDGGSAAEIVVKNKIDRQINGWLKTLGLDYALSLSSVQEAGKPYKDVRFSLKDIVSDTRVNLANVGFGTRQLIPLLGRG